MDRITDLEIKLAFMERHLLDLDTVVRELAARLERANLELAELRDGPSSLGKTSLDQERPPHYDRSLTR